MKVRVKGVCAKCPMSSRTIKMGVGECLKKSVPERVRVMPVSR